MKKSVAAVVTTLLCWLPILVRNSFLLRRDWFALFYSLGALLLVLALVQIFRHSPAAIATLRVGASLALLVFSPLLLVMILGYEENPDPSFDLSVLQGHLLLMVAFGFCMVAFTELRPLRKHLGVGVGAH